MEVVGVLWLGFLPYKLKTETFTNVEKKTQQIQNKTQGWAGWGKVKYTLGSTTVCGSKE